MPPSLGCKPRKYCSTKCRQRGCNGVHLRDAAPHSCAGCSKPLEYAGRGPRSGVLCGDCKRASRRARYTPRSRKPKTPRQVAECPACRRPFEKRKKTSKYCSRECRNTGRAVTYSCLNCETPFRKRVYPSGAVSCQTKYCSRDCAFEARRLKKQCAQRPREAAKRLANWFLSWGDDYWPHVYKCECCGGKMVQRCEVSPRHSRCVNCRPLLRECVDCGRTDLKPLCRRCGDCSFARKRAVARDARRTRRRKKGHESSFRSRCRKNRAPYTPLDKGLVLERDGWACQLCGDPLLDRHTLRDDGTVDPLSPTIDHVFPLDIGPDGPGHVHYNVIACCFACNSMKGNLNPEGWACSLVPAPDSFAADNAPRLDYKAWLKAQHQRRSTSSNSGGRRKPSTARNSAPR